MIHPFSGEHLPIVLDSDLVDPEFGTGVVKVRYKKETHDGMTLLYSS